MISDSSLSLHIQTHRSFLWRASHAHGSLSSQTLSAHVGSYWTTAYPPNWSISTILLQHQQDQILKNFISQQINPQQSPLNYKFFKAVFKVAYDMVPIFLSNIILIYYLTLINNQCQFRSAGNQTPPWIRYARVFLEKGAGVDQKSVQTKMQVQLWRRGERKGDGVGSILGCSAVPRKVQLCQWRVLKPKLVSGGSPVLLEWACLSTFTVHNHWQGAGEAWLWCQSVVGPEGLLLRMADSFVPYSRRAEWYILTATTATVQFTI